MRGGMKEQEEERGNRWRQPLLQFRNARGEMPRKAMDGYAKKKGGNEHNERMSCEQVGC